MKTLTILFGQIRTSVQKTESIIQWYHDRYKNSLLLSTWKTDHEYSIPKVQYELPNIDWEKYPSPQQYIKQGNRADTAKGSFALFECLKDTILSEVDNYDYLLCSRIDSIIDPVLPTNPSDDTMYLTPAPWIDFGHFPDIFKGNHWWYGSSKVFKKVYDYDTEVLDKYLRLSVNHEHCWNMLLRCKTRNLETLRHEIYRSDDKIWKII